MDDEIEDIIGEVKYTDSQKSIATRSSLAYSPDFTDSSSPRSDRHNSTGKETYVIECDSEDSYNDNSEQTFPKQGYSSTNTELRPTSIDGSSDGGMLMSVECGPSQVTKCASTSYHTICSVIAQETYTQTSKTIIEIAENEGGVRRVMECNSLETQTSLISITENKTVEYRIENLNDCFSKSLEGCNRTILQLKDGYFNNNNIRSTKSEYSNNERSPPKQCKQINVTCNQFLHASVDDESPKTRPSETDSENTEYTYKDYDESSGESSDDVVRPIDNDPHKDSTDEPTLQVSSSGSGDEPSDIEEDSLMEDNPKSSNTDVRELHDKLSENDDVCRTERYIGEPDIWHFGSLTPLTEETNIKKESLQDLNIDIQNTNAVVEDRISDELVFTSSAGVKVKVLKDDETAKGSFRLPPIQNHSCPNSPHVNLLFGKPKMIKAGTLPSVCERKNVQDRWEMGSKSLASGESTLISGRSESPRRQRLSIQLPPIYGEAPISSKEESLSMSLKSLPPATVPNKAPTDNQDAISIKDRIKELKLSSRRSGSQKYSSSSRAHSRPCSPESRDESLREIADRGCEAFCVDLLRRLRSNSWYDVIETLEELPKELDKFWGVITETRIADLLRQVNMLVESPRAQVAKTACDSAAAIIKNTSYTKKPDFYETVTILLVKTGSYSRVVRRSANLALDHIMCGVDVTHAVSALSIHGVSHKNPLVRSAAARLLVVCCALAGGGRGLLRARPPSAAAARRHVLRSLAALLDDKTTDVRKYAERLYSMLRPLSNFEAYYLTDVDVETASKQMKKYDPLLLCPPKTTS